MTLTGLTSFGQQIQLSKKKKLLMTIFTLLTSILVNNAFSLFYKLWPDKALNATFREFKLHICKQLVHSQLENQKKT